MIPLFQNTLKKPSNISYLINNDCYGCLVFKIKLTNFCNYNCGYCCFHSKEKEFININNIKLLKSQIDLFNNPKIKIILYGGEPLLHPDFNNIVDLLSEYDITVQTNGSLPLTNNNCFYMVTYHSKHSLKRILKNIKNVKYELVLLMNKDNIKQIELLYKVFRERYNLSVGFVFQDLPYINSNLIHKDKHICVDDKLYSYPELVKKGFTCFYGLSCKAGFNHFVIDGDKVYRCDQEHLNNNIYCNLNELYTKASINLCTSYWCTDYWAEIKK